MSSESHNSISSNHGVSHIADPKVGTLCGISPIPNKLAFFHLGNGNETLATCEECLTQFYANPRPESPSFYDDGWESY